MCGRYYGLSKDYNINFTFTFENFASVIFPASSKSITLLKSGGGSLLINDLVIYLNSALKLSKSCPSVGAAMFDRCHSCFGCSLSNRKRDLTVALLSRIR